VYGGSLNISVEYVEGYEEDEDYRPKEEAQEASQSPQ
jgi:hypothetical protein